jgi:hypothetical protein
MLVLPDTPAPGVSRIVAGRPGLGGNYNLPTPGVPTLIVPARESRLGGRIDNTGAGQVVLWLCSLEAAQAGVNAPQVTLGAGGQKGTWNFLMGNVLWAGAVVAIPTAASSVSFGEI